MSSELPETSEDSNAEVDEGKSISEALHFLRSSMQNSYSRYPAFRGSLQQIRDVCETYRHLTDGRRHPTDKELLSFASTFPLLRVQVLNALCMTTCVVDYEDADYQFLKKDLDLLEADIRRRAKELAATEGEQEKSEPDPQDIPEATIATEAEITGAEVQDALSVETPRSLEAEIESDTAVDEEGDPDKGVSWR